MEAASTVIDIVGKHDMTVGDFNKLRIARGMFATMLQRRRLAGMQVSGFEVSNYIHYKEGNFSIVHLFLDNAKGRKLSSIGVAKCNPTDTYSDDVGFRLATHRALDTALDGQYV